MTITEFLLIFDVLALVIGLSSVYYKLKNNKASKKEKTLKEKLEASKEEETTNETTTRD